MLKRKYLEQKIIDLKKEIELHRKDNPEFVVLRVRQLKSYQREYMKALNRKEPEIGEKENHFGWNYGL